jgi:hypothetical protein
MDSYTYSFAFSAILAESADTAETNPWDYKPAHARKFASEDIPEV